MPLMRTFQPRFNYMNVYFALSGPTGGNNALERRIRSSARRASCSTIENVGNTMLLMASSPQCLPMGPMGDNEDTAVGENATDLSFLKRQAKWLRRRKESLEAKIVAVEARGEVRCEIWISFVSISIAPGNPIPSQYYLDLADRSERFHRMFLGAKTA